MAYDDEDEVLDIDKGLLDEDGKKVPEGFQVTDENGLPIEEDAAEDEIEDDEEEGETF